MTNTDDSNRVQLESRSERFGVEFKPWLKLNEAAHLAVFVKAMLALRNNDGGVLFIGVEDDGAACERSRPEDAAAAYTQDELQAVVSKYASEPFEIDVSVLEHERQTVVAVNVPGGLRTPVAAKAAVRAKEKNGQQGERIREGAVFVRSLLANGRISTTEVRPADWPKLVERCFENREADVGAFVRRHLGAIDAEVLASIRDALAGAIEASKGGQSATQVAEVERTFHAHLDRIQFEGALPAATRQVALVLEGPPLAARPTEAFLQGLMAAHPSLSGWPAWVDSRRFRHEDAHPIVVDGAWEALINIKTSQYSHFDFWRIDPRGRLMLLQALEDELLAPFRGNQLETYLDPLLQVQRVAESLATGLAFAGALANEGVRRPAHFTFRWVGLEGRLLVGWTAPERGIEGGVCHTDQFTESVLVGPEVSQTALAPVVERLVGGLFAAFGGYQLPGSVIEEQTKAVLASRKRRT